MITPAAGGCKRMLAGGRREACRERERFERRAFTLAWRSQSVPRDEEPASTERSNLGDVLARCGASVVVDRLADLWREDKLAKLLRRIDAAVVWARVVCITEVPTLDLTRVGYEMPRGCQSGEVLGLPTFHAHRKKPTCAVSNRGEAQNPPAWCGPKEGVASDDLPGNPFRATAGLGFAPRHCREPLKS
jgi:hypothetical protein